MILIHTPFLWVDGLALCPFVLVKSKTNSKQLLNHERIHLRQQLEMGILLFYVWYLIEYGLGLMKYRNRWRAYRNISFEREAYHHDKDLDYLSKRTHWAFWRFV